MRTVHAEEKKRVVCTICGKTTLSISGHTSYYHKDRPKEKKFKCTQCDEKFYDEKQRTKHLATVHISYEERPHVCDFCGQRFTMRGNLTRHTKLLHFNIETFKCAQCEKTFKRGYLLQGHVNLKHLGIKPFRCRFKQCNHVYPSVSSRLKHEKKKHKYCHRQAMLLAPSEDSKDVEEG